MLKTINFAAGEQKNFKEPATFFRLLKCLYPLDVLFIRGGVVVDTSEAVEAGYSEKFLQPFDEVAIKSATSQAVQFAMRYGSEVSYDAQTITLSMGEPVRTAAFTQSVVPYGLANALLVGANPARKYLSIQNNGDETVFLNFSGAAAVLGTGIELPSRMAWVMDSWTPIGVINAISTVAGSVTVVEG